MLTKVYLQASQGNEFEDPLPLPTPDPELANLVQRMRQASPNWGILTANAQTNERQLLMITHLKFSLARGLPPGYRVDWNYFGHTIHPDFPNRWLSTTSGTSLRFYVYTPSRARHFLFVQFNQSWSTAPSPATWEEPDQIGW